MFCIISFFKCLKDRKLICLTDPLPPLCLVHVRSQCHVVFFHLGAHFAEKLKRQERLSCAAQRNNSAGEIFSLSFLTSKSLYNWCVLFFRLNYFALGSCQQCQSGPRLGLVLHHKKGLIRPIQVQEVLLNFHLGLFQE